MYRYFNSKFWSDPFIEDLSPLHKLVYIFLFTSCPNQCGIFEISERRISFETNVTIEEVKKALSVLEKGGKIYRNGNYIVLVNFLKYQANRSPKIIKKIEKELLIFQQKTDLLKVYKEKVWSVHMKLARNISFPLESKEEEKQRRTTADNISPEPPQKKLHKETIVQESIISEAHSEAQKESTSKKTGNGYTAEFETWWQAYPRKVGKKDAYKKWKKAKKEMPTLKELLEVLEKQKQSEQWQKGYIPNPATYLNQGRWEDCLEKEQSPSKEVSTIAPNPNCNEKKEVISEKEKETCRQVLFQYNLFLNELRKKDPGKTFAELAKKHPMKTFLDELISKWKKEGKIFTPISYQKLRTINL